MTTTKATEIKGHTYTATTELKSNGSRVITVTRDGEVWDTRTTKAAYAFVNLQGWDGIENVAPRYSTKRLPIGRAIEYGTCIGTIEIH